MVLELNESTCTYQQEFGRIFPVADWVGVEITLLDQAYERLVSMIVLTMRSANLKLNWTSWI